MYSIISNGYLMQTFVFEKYYLDERLESVFKADSIRQFEFT